MKDEIRKGMIKKRKNTPYSEIINKSKSIEKKLMESTEFKKSNNVLFYISYDNEVNTHDIIKKTIKSNKEVYVPISDVENKEIIISKLEDWNNLSVGAYGILEPNIKNNFPLDKIDLIIIPGIAFDDKGNRLGHGMGYYDKLLQKKKKSTKIGLAFEFQIIKQICVQKHDIPVDKIITEIRIINCKNNI